MKTKILKSKVTIEMSNEEYDKILKSLNRLDDILGTLFETQDLWMSDVKDLETIKWDLRNILNVTWDADKYRYIKRGSK
jgi:hypothetical protein